MGGCREPATLPLIGEHNIYNALAAAAIALDHGMTPSEAAAALATLRPAERRGQVLEVARVTVLNDCYNSNPNALQAMMVALASIKAKRHIVVAGEMLELGLAGPELHRESGRHAAQQKIDFVLGVRGLAREIVAGARESGLVVAASRGARFKQVEQGAVLQQQLLTPER